MPVKVSWRFQRRQGTHNGVDFTGALSSANLTNFLKKFMFCFQSVSNVYLSQPFLIDRNHTNGYNCRVKNNATTNTW